MSQADENAQEEADRRLWQTLRETGSAASRERLFNRHMGFAKAIARHQYNVRSHGDLELADLLQLAYAGLLEAIDRYDLDRGVPFRAFAAYRISGSVRDGIARMNEVREQISSRSQIRRERVRSLSVVEEGAADRSQAMQRLTEIAVGLAVGFMLEGTGLYAPESGEGDSAVSYATAYEGVAWHETVAHLHEELAVLPERERTILSHHYVGGLSFDNIAVMMGITKGRVSQIHKAALLMLQKRMRGRGHFRLEK